MATYLNKIKILDENGQVSKDSPFNFGIGTLREEKGDIVYTTPNNQTITLLQSDEDGYYTLVIPNGENQGQINYISLADYINSQEKFLKNVEYKSEVNINDILQPVLQFTFVLEHGQEKIINIPVKDLPIEADNIYFTFEGDKIKITESFGQYKPSERGYVEVPLIDQEGNKYSLQEFFQNAYRVTNNNPEVQNPSASIELYKNTTSMATANIVAEVGSTPTIYFKVEYADGNFQYAGAAGCEWHGGIVECQGQSIAVVLDKVQSLKAGSIKPDQNQIVLTYAYGASTTQATNNLEEKIDQTIAEANSLTTVTKYYIQGNYYAYGGSSENVLSSNAATIKNLKSKGNSKASSFTVTIDEGASHIMIAVPSGRKITKIADGNAFGTDIFSTFTQEENMVSVIFGAYSEDYTVYKYSTDTKLTQNILTVSLTNG